MRFLVALRMTYLVLAVTLLSFTGCGFLDEADGSGTTGGSSSSSDSDHRDRDAENKMAIALGGVAPGWDEVNIPEENLDGRVVDFTTQYPDIIDFEPLEGYPNFTQAGGGRVIPLKIGVGTFRYSLGGSSFGPLTLVTIPPQPLIQILIGEAWGQLSEEATLDDSGNVTQESVSLAGEAIASVISNRINLINDENNPGLFVVDQDAYEEEPYRAVIEAEYNGYYQFHPVDPENEMHEDYLNAAYREDLDPALQVAYDQALLTAADIYSGDAPDPTNGAFSFYSPDVNEYQVLRRALQSETTDLPSGAGKSDAQFPALAPIQILILDGIPEVTRQGEEVPSFVFVRSRDIDDPAVTDEP